MKIKQIVALILVVCMLLSAVCLLAGCAKRGQCEECGQTETLKKYVDSDGDTHWLCADCTKLAKLFGY